MVTKEAENAVRHILSTEPGSVYGKDVVAQIPRILSQIDRNPHSPTYGSCCRNFWHYRIEDISNSQLQEAVLTLAIAYKQDANWNPYANSPLLLEWIGAVLNYWTKLQSRSGSFDEVYCGQDSYAATAFSSYCASEAAITLGSALDVQIRDTAVTSLLRSIAWLEKTEEELASNQLAGAAAAMYNTYLLTDEAVAKQAARNLVDKLIKIQNEEGWFNEYGGADIGYSSITFDYLCKLWAKSGWGDVLQLARNLLGFLVYFIHQDSTAGGVYGSRNTEYFIPHGIELLAPHDRRAMSISNLLLTKTIEQPERSLLHRLDDRYLCYLSGFFLQSSEAAAARSDFLIDLPFTRPHNQYFKNAGLWSVATDDYHLVVNTAKGGVFRCDFHNGSSFQSSGLFVTDTKGNISTTQSLNLPPKVDLSETDVIIEAPLVRLRHITVSTWRMLAFKLYNLLVPGLMRRKVLDLIRMLAISRGKRIALSQRTIRLGSVTVSIEDKLLLPVGTLSIRNALATERSFSFASCGFFHPAELEHQSSQSVEILSKGPCEVTIGWTVDQSGWHQDKKEISPINLKNGV